MTRRLLARSHWAKTPRDPDRLKAIGATLAATLLGVACGGGLGLLARVGLQIAGGYFMIVAAILLLAVAALALERFRARSGAPVAALVISLLLAAGPIGLYYLLPAIVLVTPVALYRALRQKYS